MPLDKVLSSSIANGAVTAALISNTADLVVSSLTANVITITTISGSANVTGDMTVGGNLTISGTTTYVNTTDLNIGDAIISLNADLAANVSPTENAGLNINRGASTNAQFVWVESTDNWSLGNTTVSGILNANDTIITGTANVSTGINVGVNVNLSTSQINVGNSTVNTTITNITLSTNTVNVASIINVGANVSANTTALRVGNSTVNTVITSTALTTTSNTVTLGTAAYFVANGNVGVGTDAPVRKLHVQTTGANSEVLVTTVSSGNPRIGLDASGAYYNWIQTDRTSGAIQFAISNSESMRLDASGNLGLGVTPSAWTTFTSAIEVPGGALAGISANQVGVWQNCFYNSSSFKYKSTAAATLYQQSGGTHVWYNAASGTAGNNITFTQAMTLDASGNLGLGNTINSYGSQTTFTLSGSNVSRIDFRSNSTFTGTVLSYQAVTEGLRLQTEAGYPITFYPAGTERMRIAANGNIGIGTTETGVAKVNIGLAGTTITGNTTGVSMGSGAIFQLNNSNAATTNSTVMLLGGGTGSTVGQISSGFGFTRENGESNWGTQIRFYTHPPDVAALSTLNEVARIDSNGNLLLGATTSLNTNGFQLSKGSGASSSPYAAIFNTATSPTSAASTRFDLGFLSGVGNYVATGTVLGQMYFMGQANDAGYAGAFINATIISGGNVARASGHSVALAFGTKSSSSSGAVEAMRINSSGQLLVGTTTPESAVSNTKRIVGGSFSSFNGVLNSVSSGVAYTMFTMTADFTSYIVTVSALVSTAAYSETAIVHLNNTAVSVTIIAGGSAIAIQNTGMAVQVVQSSGATVSELLWSAMRIT